MVGSERRDGKAELSTENTARLGYILTLAPGEEISLAFGLAIESQGGSPAAIENLEKALDRRQQLLAERVDQYDQLSRSRTGANIT